MKKHFYTRSVHTSTIAFASLFKDMKVKRYNRDGSTRCYLPVAVTLDHAEKINHVIRNGSAITNNLDNYLPRISIQITGMNMLGEQIKNKVSDRKFIFEFDQNGEKTRVVRDLVPVPYQYDYKVSIWTKYMDDQMQLIENIAPFFDPSINVPMTERGFGIERDMKVTLGGIGLNNDFVLSKEDVRILKADLDFQVESVMYKPFGIDQLVKTPNIDFGTTEGTTGVGTTGTTGTTATTGEGDDVTNIDKATAKGGMKITLIPMPSPNTSEEMIPVTDQPPEITFQILSDVDKTNEFDMFSSRKANKPIDEFGNELG